MVRSVFTIAAVVVSSLIVANAMAAQSHITKAQAKHEIEGDGYTRVANIHEAKGGWEASALESGKPVTVLVTRSGVVEKTK